MTTSSSSGSELKLAQPAVQLLRVHDVVRERTCSHSAREAMEFLAGFELKVLEGASESEVEQRVSAEAAASAELAREGHLARLWRPPVAPGERKAIGLYRAGSEAELDGLLGALPLSGWMETTVTPLEAHSNDPANQADQQTREPTRDSTGATRGARARS
jgi:muconolactone D-isomerase